MVYFNFKNEKKSLLKKLRVLYDTHVYKLLLLGPKPRLNSS